MTNKDMRSELAIKRDEWLESKEGKSCCCFETLMGIAGGEGYLKNRIEAAFLAGAKANEAVKEEICKKAETSFNSNDLIASMHRSS